MDLQKILDQTIKDLPAGPYKIDLKAVMAHIDAAIKHYKRGQSEPDQTLFIDAVFRCNQAFEGSVKEAYRVLAGKDPSRIAPHKIEEFRGEADLLRKKVLDQFTRYRTEWRNPFHARLHSRFRRGRRPDGNRNAAVGCQAFTRDGGGVVVEVAIPLRKH
ncbi:hypothetical protein IVB27_15695 [Bradyrhizobium sp. 197]|uniref:hypothetical protein n=1 Tax=Bradyrhizobium sp. 197 TaxID=2782663 RepID=UPI001FF7D7DB|nr:hypothetical protein [Bradyrhizobium sp. 197]MCK1476211.1 hypothetical protein [Bradyrhizobium sp. 197]